MKHRPQYLDEFGSRQIAYVAVSESGSCGFSSKARQMGTKGGPAHTTPLHQLGQKVALEEEGKFVRQLAHKTRLDIDVCDLKSLPVAADIRPALESGIVATVGSTTRQTIEFLELMNLYVSGDQIPLPFKILTLNRYKNPFNP